MKLFSRSLNRKESDACSPSVSPRTSLTGQSTQTESTHASAGRFRRLSRQLSNKLGKEGKEPHNKEYKIRPRLEAYSTKFDVDPSVLQAMNPDAMQAQAAYREALQDECKLQATYRIGVA